MSRTCCLCGKPCRKHEPEPIGKLGGLERHAPFDWAEWRIKGRSLAAHETCVVELIEETVRQRRTGQGELFGVASGAEPGRETA